MILLRYLLGVVLCFVALASAAPAGAAPCAPSTLVHIVVTNVTPGIAPASFNAQPKVYYRLGSDKMRLEEAVDTANGIHLVAVVAEPNIWMANLYDGTGRHAVDPGPTYFAKAPVIGAADLSGKLIGLEFGCEADFIAQNAPKPTRSEKIGNDTFDVYRVEDGASAVEILEKSGSNIPAFVRYFQQGSLAMVLRYDIYETGLPPNPDLFTPPANVRYR